MPPTGILSDVFRNPPITTGTASVSSPPDNSITTGHGRIPLVTMDQDVITDEMAARLATSLIGHVLFLKSQVPFPVIQLSRIPGLNSNARAVKMRNELMGSFDTLTSHLSTTFTALSTAIALATRSLKHHSCAVEEHAHGGDTETQKRQPVRSRAYLAIMVGPSIGSARAKVLFAVDGLEAKVWGERDDYVAEVSGRSLEEDDGSEGSEEEHSDEEDEEDGTDSGDSKGFDSRSDIRNECASPPPSRSPSPHPRPHQPPLSSHADEQQVLRAADRLLSRVLADADGDGRSMACEMAPTQTHILIRAPRRFSHPAWIPRQNMTSTLEGMLDEFLDDSNMGRRGEGRAKRRVKAVVEGVWVRCSGQGVCEFEGNSNDEMDEMIWWSWNGKIVGFADW